MAAPHMVAVIAADGGTSQKTTHEGGRKQLFGRQRLKAVDITAPKTILRMYLHYYFIFS